MNKANAGWIFVWIGAALVLTGLIIILVMIPGWLWCVVGALVLVGIGLLLLKPLLRR